MHRPKVLQDVTEKDKTLHNINPREEGKRWRISCAFLPSSTTFTNTDEERVLKPAAAPVVVQRGWRTVNDQSLKAGIHPQKKRKKKQKKAKKQEWDGVEEEEEGDVWVKFVYTAPERRGGGEEWED